MKSSLWFDLSVIILFFEVVMLSVSWIPIVRWVIGSEISCSNIWKRCKRFWCWGLSMIVLTFIVVVSSVSWIPSMEFMAWWEVSGTNIWKWCLSVIVFVLIWVESSVTWIECCIMFWCSGVSLANVSWGWELIILSLDIHCLFKESCLSLIIKVFVINPLGEFSNKFLWSEIILQWCFDMNWFVLNLWWLSVMNSVGCSSLTHKSCFLWCFDINFIILEIWLLGFQSKAGFDVFLIEFSTIFSRIKSLWESSQLLWMFKWVHINFFDLLVLFCFGQFILVKESDGNSWVQ